MPGLGVVRGPPARAVRAAGIVVILATHPLARRAADAESLGRC